MRDEEQRTPYERELGRRLTNEQVIREIKDRLSSNLETLYPDIDKSMVVLNGYSLGGQFAQTFRFVLEYSGKKIDIFSKICPLYESLDPAKKEFETLKIVYEKMNSLSNKYAVSRPLIYFSDLNCYAMESVGEKDLRTILLKSNTLFAGPAEIKKLMEYMQGSAEWLSLFHAITSDGKVCQFNVDKFLESFTNEFDYTELDSYRFKISFASELDKLLKRISANGHKLTMPLARWHWDYTPGHVYLDNNKISVIDILGLEDTPIYEDIGHFLASITCINNLPKYPLFNRKRSANDFTSHFVESYYDENKLVRNEYLILVNLYKLKHLIIYFLIQNRQISQRIGAGAAAIYSNIRAVRVFEGPMSRAIVDINHILDIMNKYD